MRRLNPREILAIILVVIFAAISGVSVGWHLINKPAITKPISTLTPQSSANQTILSFNCIVNNDDKYELDIINGNPYTVATGNIIVGFYNQADVEMGQDTPYGLAIPADTTYAYQGTYSQTQLGGIPSACQEVQWQIGQ